MAERMALWQWLIGELLRPTGTKPMWRRHWLLAVLLALSSHTAVGNSPMDSGGLSYDAEGRASYYSSRLHGRPTASGEEYDETALTAAHPHLPFDTQLCITNLKNGRSTAVRVNDRGPFVGGRIIDVSRAAARELGMLRAGTAKVKVEACSMET